ncbi:hypothetical protein O181_063845 [Austropuccinia psidii MF-1]|uniref:Uncharacterized protein n=1 Tax=Austropuccinia psidii MF-1 TaxID=1389203 RepID=A0A9Q3EJH0_9BASI|nr:hypothetical protein [Austropuccinia psidii MF-1]
MIPVQNSPPERNTRSQTRTSAVITQKPRAPLDGTPEVPHLRAHLDRGPIIEEENSEEEKESYGTEVGSAPVGDSEGTGEKALSQSNQHFSHHSYPSLLVIMQRMTQIMENI